MVSALLRSSLSRPVRLPASAHLGRRTLITLRDVTYTAHATSAGPGRNGKATSEGAPDALPLELKMAVPKSMGGRGNGHNPEQLFAMGYASCFLGALHLAARNAGIPDSASRAKVHATVHLGHPEGLEGFGLRVKLAVENVEEDSLIAAAHALCPYSRALSQGVVVEVGKA